MSSRPAAVHPWAPRFAQGITAALCLEALMFGEPAGVYVAFGLVLVSVVAPGLSPVSWLFRRIAPAPRELEPAAPVRFSQSLAAAALAVATALLALGQEAAGWTIAGAVAALALLASVAGVCVGCSAYRLLLARRSSGGDLRDDLGLDGAGPWLVMLTAPGCARCEPAAQELQALAGARPVVRVDLSRRPRAGAVPVRSVPAALAVDAEGRLRAARAGRLTREDLSTVLEALPGAAPA